MPAVGDLLCVWRSEFRTFRMGATAIPTDDLYTFVLLELLFQGRRFPIWQDVYWNPPLQIDQDRSIAFSLTKRKIIHSEYARGGSLLFWLGANEPEQRIRAGGQAHPFHQALACLSTERKANEREDIGESCGAPGIGFHDAGETLRENLLHTFRVRAEKAAHMQLQAYGPPIQGRSATWRT